MPTRTLHQTLYVVASLLLEHHKEAGFVSLRAISWHSWPVALDVVGSRLIAVGYRWMLLDVVGSHWIVLDVIECSMSLDGIECRWIMLDVARCHWIVLDVVGWR